MPRFRDFYQRKNFKKLTIICSIKSMKIALIGYGKMNQMIDQLAQTKGHQIVSCFSRRLGTTKERTQDLVQADLAIDFSQGSEVLNHLNICLSLGKPLIIGTTGWEEHLKTAQHLVEQAKGSCLYAANFSIGFYLFQQTMTYAASLFQLFNDYDVSGIEYHHRQKLDQPSGTAKTLTREVLDHMPRIPSLEFASVRCGYIPGTHTLQFDGPGDTLIFTHQVRNRQVFAEGALMAAEWLLPRQGFFKMNDMMRDLLYGTNQ
jgi:4-hydroxy-tetrahydrodipicolinate reductase